MLIAVDFISRDAFERVVPAADLAVISIGDPAECLPITLHQHAQTLRMEFLDCDLAGLVKWGYPAEALCSLQQLEQMVAFIREVHEAPAPRRLVVHCRMGASRSAAVALVAQAITDCDMPRRAEANYANTHVLMLAQQLIGLEISPPTAPDGNLYVFLRQDLAI